MFGCQQILIKPEPKLKAVREYICQQSNKLHNCAVYCARQMYFKRQAPNRPFDLINEPKRHPQWGALCAQAAQQTCGAVGESVKSIKGLIKLFWDGKLEHKPRFPKNRKNRTPGGLHLIAYPKQALAKKMIDGQISIPMGRKVKAGFGWKNFPIQMPSNLNYTDIREVRIIRRHGCFYAEFVAQSVNVQTDTDSEKVLGIDRGIDNWLTCASNVGTSSIVDACHLKSLNQWYNKRVATLINDKPNGFWSHQLARLTEKRHK